MDDGVVAFGRLFEGVGIADVAANQTKALSAHHWRQRLGAKQQPVINGYVVTGLPKLASEGGADVAGAP